MEELIFFNAIPHTAHTNSLPAMVSIKVQTLGETYDVETGFNCGTSFPELNKPFLAGGVRYE